MIRFKFFNDPDGSLHFAKHDVSIEEIDEFFNDNDHFIENRKDGPSVAYGRLKSGRYLTVVFRVLEKDLYFIITAYDFKDLDIINYIDKELDL